MSELSSLFTNILDKISIYTKEGLENLTSAMIVIFSLLFIHTHIVDINSFSNYLGLLFYPIMIIMLYFIKINLFSYDYLLFGKENNKYVKAFQFKLPSKYIADTYEIEKKDAGQYWYNIYNKWQKESDPRYSQVLRTFRRGYACKFIFYSIKVFEFYSILSFSIFILLHAHAAWLAQKIYLIPESYSMFSFIFITGLLRILILKINNPDLDNLSGVWEKFAEINENHIIWLKANIKSKEDLI